MKLAITSAAIMYKSIENYKTTEYLRMKGVLDSIELQIHTLAYFHKDLKKKKILTDDHKQEEI